MRQSVTQIAELVADICVELADKLPAEHGTTVIHVCKERLNARLETFSKDKFIDYISEQLGRQV